MSDGASSQRKDSAAAPRGGRRDDAADAERGGRPGSFEEATARLGAIVTELEGGDLPLERALALFEEGVRLARDAQDRLDRAERRVDELLGIDGKGQPITREFEG